MNSLYLACAMLACYGADHDQIIDQYQHIVQEIVDDHLRKFPADKFLKDDLVGEGLLALVAAADKLDDSVTNVGAYLRISVRNAVKKLVDEEHDPAHSASTQAKARSKGIELEPPEIVLLSDPARSHGHDHNGSLADVIVDHQSSVDDLRELIFACCYDDIDTRIIQLREEGHSDRECAEIVSQEIGPITNSGVFHRRKAIEERFNQKVKE